MVKATSEKEPIEDFTDGKLKRELKKLKALNYKLISISKRQGESIGAGVAPPPKGTSSGSSTMITTPDSGKPEPWKKPKGATVRQDSTLHPEWGKDPHTKVTDRKDSEGQVIGYKYDNPFTKPNKESKLRTSTPNTNYQNNTILGRSDKKDEYSAAPSGIKESYKAPTDTTPKPQSKMDKLRGMFGRGSSEEKIERKIQGRLTKKPTGQPKGTGAKLPTRKPAPIHIAEGTKIREAIHNVNPNAKRGKKQSVHKDGTGYGNLWVSNIESDSLYNDTTFVGRSENPAIVQPNEHETYILNNASKHHIMNKITNTQIGDDIHYYVNGKESRGVIAKMSNTYVTIFKEDGLFYEVPINETFFVKDILVNKTWDNMTMEERAVSLTKIRAYSPRFLGKTWKQLPSELRDVLTSKSDVESGNYGGVGSTAEVLVSTQLGIDAEKDYEGDTHRDYKDQFKHEEKKPKTKALEAMKALLNKKIGALPDTQSTYDENAIGKPETEDINEAHTKIPKTGEAPKLPTLGKADASVTTSTEGAFNATNINDKKIIKKSIGVPQSNLNTWGIRYLSKEETDKEIAKLTKKE